MSLRSFWLRLSLGFITLLLVTVAGVWSFFLRDFEATEAWAGLRRDNLELATQLKDTIVQSDSDVARIGEKRGLPLIGIKLSRKDIVHFSDLYKKYEDPKFGMEYYAQQNLWRDAELTYQDRTYAVKIKAHGRSPSNHRSGKYISLAVKMPRGENINNSRRFSLLVRDHFVPKKQVVFDVADHFGLLKNQEHLVRVQINNWEEKLFFFDRRLNDAWMEVEGRPSLRVFGYSFSHDSTIKSSIYTGGPFDEAAYRARFQQTLIELEYPPSQHQPLIDRYTAFNRAIYEGRDEALEEFCDMDYLSSFQAFRLICGLIGHIARQDNLYVFYDTANGKFYPVVTRDCWMEKIPLINNGSAELFVDTAGPWEQPLFRMLSRNLDVRREAYRKIYEYSQQYEDTLEERHRRILERYDKLSYFGWATVGMRNVGLMQDNYTVNNLQCLKYFMDSAQPKLKITVDQDKLSLAIGPQSMGGVRVDYLTIAADRQLSPTEIPVSVWGQIEDGEQRQAIPLRTTSVRAAGDRIDLSPVFRDIDFITPLSEASQRIPRVYVVLIQLDTDQLRMGIGPIELALSNGVTGARIEDFAAEFQAGSFDVEDYPQQAAPPEDMGWLAGHENLNLQIDPRAVTLKSGDYTIQRDWVLPKNRKLVIEAGTTLRLAKNVAICGYQGVDVWGTKEMPVTITSIDPYAPFGSVGFLGNSDTVSHLEHMHVHGGYERWVNGVYFSAAFSLHDHAAVSMQNCSFHDNLADDGLNIKYCPDVQIVNCEFRDNAADQVDLDLCQGKVEDCRFWIETRRDANGDGLDVSGAKLVVTRCQFQGFPDKGISVGERSRIEVRNNQFLRNTTGVAIKDSSHAFFVDNQFDQNRVDLDAFQKKTIFSGGTIWLGQQPSETTTVFLDAKSSAFAATSLSAFGKAVIADTADLAPSDDWKPVLATFSGDPSWRVPLVPSVPQEDASPELAESEVAP